MLSPKKVKYRKQQKGRMKGHADRGAHLYFGDYALIATECAFITARQIEAARIAMTRYIKRGGDIWIRIFPDKPLTKKPAETRMGSGKGNVEEWVAVVKPGRIIYEMSGIPKDQAVEALRLAGHKLPLTCKVIFRQDSDKRAHTIAGRSAARLERAAEEGLAAETARKAEDAAKTATATPAAAADGGKE